MRARPNDREAVIIGLVASVVDAALLKRPSSDAAFSQRSSARARVRQLAASRQLKFDMVSSVSFDCPRCQGTLHHSRPRSWVERLRRHVTGRAPFRCHSCNWRGWRKDVRSGPNGLREIHRELTDAELERLEPDNSKGDRS